MASITPSLLWLTSNILSPGVDCVFRPSNTRLPLEYQPIKPKSSLIEPLEPLSLNIARQWVCIAVNGYSSDCPWTIDNAHLLVDTTQPITVEARLTSRAPSPLSESFRKLGEAVNLIGAEVVTFKSWYKLIVVLPHSDLSCTSCTFQPLPVDALQNLRSLEWTGSSSQGLFSWFFPTLPAALQTVTLKYCDLSLSDCAYIMRHGKTLKSLTIQTIRPNSFVDSAVLPFRYPPSRIPVALETLAITSTTDICPLLSLFTFPFLSSILISLQYTGCLATLQDLDTLDWRRLRVVNIFGDVSLEDQDRIRQLCGPKTQFDLRYWSRMNAPWYD